MIKPKQEKFQPLQTAGGLTLALLLSLTACKNKQNEVTVKKSYTAHMTKQSQKLYFSGELQPIRESAVSTPAQAIVQKMQFNYGGLVEKGKVIVRLNSPAQQKEYDETLTGYLKAKDQLETQKAKYAGTKSLWDAGLVSQNTYKNDQSSLLTNKIAFLQEKTKLISMASKFKDISSQKVLNLSLNDFDAVKKMLHEDKNTIVLKAPHSGIALLPESNGNDKKQLRVGSELKSGDVVTLVGDISGLSISIKIPEINIDKLKPGMKAVVTGIAFPNIILDAKLVNINAQANSTSGGGGLPTFSAKVIVPKLTERQKQVLKVGMSASVTVILSEKEVMLIPIKAVKINRDTNLVQVKRASGKIEKVFIKTGYSTPTEVEVLSGLKPGEQIVWTELEKNIPPN